MTHIGQYAARFVSELCDAYCALSLDQKVLAYYTYYDFMRQQLTECYLPKARFPLAELTGDRFPLPVNTACQLG